MYLSKTKTVRKPVGVVAQAGILTDGRTDRHSTHIKPGACKNGDCIGLIVCLKYTSIFTLSLPYLFQNIIAYKH